MHSACQRQRVAWLGWAAINTAPPPCQRRSQSLPSISSAGASCLVWQVVVARCSAFSLLLLIIVVVVDSQQRCKVLLLAVPSSGLCFLCCLLHSFQLLELELDEVNCLAACLCSPPSAPCCRAGRFLRPLPAEKSPRPLQGSRGRGRQAHRGSVLRADLQAALRQKRGTSDQRATRGPSLFLAGCYHFVPPPPSLLGPFLPYHPSPLSTLSLPQYPLSLSLTLTDSSLHTHTLYTHSHTRLVSNIMLAQPWALALATLASLTTAAESSSSKHDGRLAKRVATNAAFQQECVRAS